MKELNEQLYRKVDSAIRLPKKGGYYPTNFGNLEYKDKSFLTVLSSKDKCKTTTEWWLEEVHETIRKKAPEHE